MYRLIHCADLHLDSSLRGILPPREAAVRRQELTAAFLSLVDSAVSLEADAVLIAGDLFDTERVSAAAASAVSAALRDHPEILFFYLQGNHDQGSFTGSLEEIPDNLVLFDHSFRRFRLAPGLVLTGAELPPPPGREEAFWDSLVLDPSDYNIVVLHGQLVKGRTASCPLHIPAGALSGRGIDYLALGHIHSHRAGRLDARGIWCYPGCLEARGFDETGRHGFVVLDIDPDLRKAERRFAESGGRRALEVSSDLTGLTDSASMERAIRESLDREGARPEDLVHVILEGDLPYDCEMSPDLLRARLSSLYYLVRLTDLTRFAVDYSRSAGDPSLRGEFIRLVWTDDSLTEEEKAAVIRCGILALEGEEV